jgi:smad nuclear-interacting protein 1
LDHPSCSKQHAVIQHRLVTLTEPETNSTTRIVKPYLLDLASANKTRLNGVEVEDSRFIELREKDVLRFGASSREYVLVAEKRDTPTSPP